MADRKNILVFSAHAADFVWRAGGAIALAYCTLDPRGTRDLDFNVFVGAERAREVFAALPDKI